MLLSYGALLGSLVRSIVKSQEMGKLDVVLGRLVQLLYFLIWLQGLYLSLARGYGLELTHHLLALAPVAVMGAFQLQRALSQRGVGKLPGPGQALAIFSLNALFIAIAAVMKWLL